MNFETIKKYLGKRTRIVAAVLGFPIAVGGIYLAVGIAVLESVLASARRAGSLALA